MALIVRFAASMADGIVGELDEVKVLCFMFPTITSGFWEKDHTTAVESSSFPLACTMKMMLEHEWG